MLYACSKVCRSKRFYPRNSEKNILRALGVKKIFWGHLPWKKIFWDFWLCKKIFWAGVTFLTPPLDIKWSVPKNYLLNTERHNTIMYGPLDLESGIQKPGQFHSSLYHVLISIHRISCVQRSRESLSACFVCLTLWGENRNLVFYRVMQTNRLGQIGVVYTLVGDHLITDTDTCV